jgi:exo-beta-1,3-glucanase (GH17 family)
MKEHRLGGSSMKYLVQTAFAAALIGVSSYSYAAQNGINYDPAHNPAYVEAQRKNNLSLMTSIINTDLSQVKNTLKFNIIKTFYSRFCTNIPTCVPIAKLASDAKLQVLLGVFEFQPSNSSCIGNSVNGQCATVWTKPGVDEAIMSANNYPDTVIGVIVGSEDMFTYNGITVQDLQQRIVVDINTIKSGVNNKSLPVTTAQRQPDWCGGSMPGCASNRTNSLNQEDPFGVLKTVQVIGANIYPYWGGSKEQVNGVSVASQIQTTAADLKAALNKDVIITEEGWPSCSSPSQNPQASIDFEADYFSTWSMHTSQVFDSYYFMTYDLKPDSGCPGGADQHFGLCKDTGATKASNLIGCGLSAAPPPIFVGTPGFSNCLGQSITALDRQFGGRNAAAAARGFSGVRALEKAIIAFCQQ